MWIQQWTLFAENFYDGKAHIAIKEKTLLLLPGPGFGDLSHPTTRLMMQLMQDYVANQPVLDIGTGSGILALASLFLNASSALGIDIDDEALKHARKNGKLNQLKCQFRKTAPKNLGHGHIALMNMIFSEQKMVDPTKWNPFAKLWITSGILVTQVQEYLAQTQKWGWELLLFSQESEWCGFVFRNNFGCDTLRLCSLSNKDG